MTDRKTEHSEEAARIAAAPSGTKTGVTAHGVVNSAEISSADGPAAEETPTSSDSGFATGYGFGGAPGDERPVDTLPMYEPSESQALGYGGAESDGSTVVTDESTPLANDDSSKVEIGKNGVGPERKTNDDV